MAQLIGMFRIGRDAELRNLDDGTPIANVSLAYNFGRKGQDGKRPTQWVDASMWGRLAESVSPYMLQGGTVFATLDDVAVETYNKNDGSMGCKLVGKISNLELGQSGGQGGGQQGNQSRQAPPQQRQQAGYGQRPQGNGQRPQGNQQRPPQGRPAPRQAAPMGSGGSGFDDMADDDIPFISASMSHDMTTSKSRRMGRYEF